MSRPIEQALNNLIPRHSGSLPPELIELASSLLAQSRSRISNLRAEEEIGRTYTCAHIACERLKTSLNLPTIEPRPPCPPKLYKKLYGHFDQLLVAASSRKRAKPAAHANPAQSSRLFPQKQTSSREKSLEGFKSNRTPKRGLKYGSNKEKERLPKWVGPTIRKICNEFDAGKAVPHVWAGVESILYLPCPNAEAVEGDKMEGKLPALVVAVVFFVLTKLMGRETNAKEYVRRLKKALNLLRDLREDEGVVAKVGTDEGAWRGWEEVVRADVDHWLSDIAVREWNTLDWYTNIEEGSGVSGVAAGEDEMVNENGDEVVERVNKRMRPTGLGSMMQDKFDYLSEKKRAEYAMWKEAMLAKINELVAGGIMNDDIDTAEG